MFLDMGFLDKAKKVAEQAKEMAGQAKELAEDLRDDAAAKRDAGTPSPTPSDPKFGTPYVPGMLGRPGWRERGLADPAAVLTVDERDRAGVPRSTRSEVVEEPFGMGRRWSAAGRSAGLFYRLYPEQQAWEPPDGAGTTATLPDGRSLTFLGAGEQRVVLEVSGIDAGAQEALARAVTSHLSAG